MSRTDEIIALKLSPVCPQNPPNFPIPSVPLVLPTRSLSSSSPRPNNGCQKFERFPNAQSAFLPSLLSNCETSAGQRVDLTTGDVYYAPFQLLEFLTVVTAILCPASPRNPLFCYSGYILDIRIYILYCTLQKEHATFKGPR